VDVPREAARLNDRKFEVLAWSIFGLCIALAVTALVFDGLAPPSKDVQAFGSQSIIGQLTFILPLLSLPLIGGFLAGRVPRNPIGWIMLGSGLCWMLTAFHDSYLALGQHVSGRIPPFADWLALVGWVPGLTLLLIFTLLLFPNGTLPSPRWRPVLWLTCVVVPVASFVTALSPNNPGEPVVGVPVVLRPLIPLATKLSPVVFLLPVLFVVSGISLFVRSRRASAEDRTKIKWIAFGALVAVLYFALTFVIATAFDKQGNALRPLALVLETGLFFAVAAIPISIGFAVLRFRLYEIDRIISRTLSYALVTVVLAAVYVLVVLGPTSLIGNGGGAPPWLIAVATLVVALLFSPVRGRLQRIVDQRFNRNRYDAARVLEDFGARLRQQVDIDELRPAIEGVVRETMRPSSVRLWLAR
jgi:hypothetical protein